MEFTVFFLLPVFNTLKKRTEKDWNQLFHRRYQELQWFAAHLWHWVWHFLGQILQQLLSDDVAADVFRTLICQDLTVVLPWAWFSCSQEVALQQQYKNDYYEIMQTPGNKKKNKTEVKLIIQNVHQIIFSLCLIAYPALIAVLAICRSRWGLIYTVVKQQHLFIPLENCHS